MSQKKKILAAMFAAQIVLADPASAAVVFFDDFSGSNLDFLNGTSPDTNDLGTNPAATWATATTGTRPSARMAQSSARQVRTPIAELGLIWAQASWPRI